MFDFNGSFINTSTMLTALIVILIVYVSVFIPSMMVPGSKPEGIAKAISCYLWKTLGLILIAISVVQLAIHIVFQSLPDSSILSALILLLATGIGIMVHASRLLVSIDGASSMIPRLVFSHTVEIVGGLITLISALSLTLNIIITERIVGWEMPVTMAFLGFAMMLSAGLHINVKNGRAGKKARK